LPSRAEIGASSQLCNPSKRTPNDRSGARGEADWMGVATTLGEIDPKGRRCEITDSVRA
jgi:hypothetical protein